MDICRSRIVQNARKKVMADINTVHKLGIVPQRSRGDIGAAELEAFRDILVSLPAGVTVASMGPGARVAIGV